LIVWPGIVELHHRRGHRDPALLLDFHPVGRRVPRALSRLHRAGQLDRAAEEQQLLGQRRLARVGVGDDGERASSLDFIGDSSGRHRVVFLGDLVSCSSALRQVAPGAAAGNVGSIVSIVARLSS
jgi:hypothetical protein